MEKKIKNFKQMYSLDLSKYIVKKPTFKKEGGKYVKLPEKYWLDYIEWATVLTLLYENGAQKVKFGVFRNEKGFPMFSSDDGKAHFVRVWVEIDGEKYEIDYPVNDGSKSLQSPTALEIHKSQLRAFVKCVAINTGLGLPLWQKEEMTFEETDAGEVELLKKTPRKPKLPKEKFKDAVKYLKDGGTIEKLMLKYSIDEKTKEMLVNAAMD